MVNKAFKSVASNRELQISPSEDGAVRLTIKGEWTSEGISLDPDTIPPMMLALAESAGAPLFAGLRAIQELHVPYVNKSAFKTCMRCGITWPCKTRQLADKTLGEKSNDQ